MPISSYYETEAKFKQCKTWKCEKCAMKNLIEKEEWKTSMYFRFKQRTVKNLEHPQQRQDSDEDDEVVPQDQEKPPPLEEEAEVKLEPDSSSSSESD